MKKPEKTKECRCPYCDEPVRFESPFCQTCKAELIFCEKCGEPIPKNDEKCPKCGAEK